MNDPTTIAVVGAGYVGLATSAMLLELGCQVTVIDVSAQRIELLKIGTTPIVEPGLDEILNRARLDDRITFSTSYEPAILEASLIFLAVGTPTTSDGTADLSFVHSAVARIHSLSPHATVVIKSTVPPGTNSNLHARFPGISFISNPEFLRQGTAVADSLSPDRIVIGTPSPLSMDVLQNLYEPLTSAGANLLITDPESVEIIKYAANSLLAVRIAFINEIADLCEVIGADIDDVAVGIGLDPRIGRMFLEAGPGFGGSCFPKDTHAIIATSNGLGSPIATVEAAARSNEYRRATLDRRVLRVLHGEPSNLTIGVLGLTFKAGTDDVRESPAIDLIAGLLRAGVAVQAYDPAGMTHAIDLIPTARLVDSPIEVARGADAVVIVTEWPEFRDLDFVSIAMLMRGDQIIDLRNLLEPDDVLDAGLVLHQIGKDVKRSSDVLCTSPDE